MLSLSLSRSRHSYLISLSLSPLERFLALLLFLMMLCFCRFTEILCDKNKANGTQTQMHTCTHSHLNIVYNQDFIGGFAALPHSNCIIEMENLTITHGYHISRCHFICCCYKIDYNNFCPPQRYISFERIFDGICVIY